MKTNGKVLLLIFMMLAGAVHSYGQGLRQGDDAYARLEYKRAIKYYTDYLKKDPNNYEVNKKLASCYGNIRDYDNMLYTYEKIIDGPNTQPDDDYTMSKLYMMHMDYVKAKKYADKYQLKQPGEKANYLQTSISSMPMWLAKGNTYVQDLTTGSSISKFSVASPELYDGNLLVTIEALNKDLDRWGEEHYLEVYRMTNSLQLGESFMNLKGMRNKHESQSAIDRNAKRYYFTTNHDEGDPHGNVDIHKLKISYIDLNDANKKQKDIPYNDIRYNVCHPTISDDGSMLVFASDKPGGKGGMDLYLCQKTVNGNWSEPENMAILNTYGDEKFPSFIGTGKFSFSSDALPGMGGLDIFVTDYSGSTFSLPVNPGAIINSSQNDFGLATTSYSESGYLTSNRNTNSSRYEVIHYATAVKETIADEIYGDTKRLNILVVDKYTEIPLSGVTISLVKPDGTKLPEQMTNDEGKAGIDVPRGALISIEGMKNGIATTSASVGLVDYASEDAVIFKKLTHNDPRFTLVGEVRERKTKTPVNDVKVKLDNESMGSDRETRSDKAGKFEFQLEQKSDFTVKGYKSGIYSNSKNVTTKGLDRSTTLYAKLYLNVDVVCLGNNLIIDNIYYDYNKWNIRYDARKPLNELVDLLNDYPDMRIELSSHTDKRGGLEFNDNLSQKRAQSAVAYLVSEGISPNRVVARGYGERRPAVECEPCTEEQHQANRRTEVQILECASCPPCD